MAQPQVLIVSQNEDFTAPLAELIRSELALPCSVAGLHEVAKNALESILLVVTSEPGEINYSCPVIHVRQWPVKMAELLEQVASIRQKQSTDDLTLGADYVLQYRLRQLFHVKSGKSVLLTDKETQLLQTLAEARGRVVTRDDLLKNVWGIESALDTHTLETHIYRLRGKFRELAGDDSVVTAEDGGYAVVLK